MISPTRRGGRSPRSASVGALWLGLVVLIEDPLAGRDLTAGPLREASVLLTAYPVPPRHAAARSTAARIASASGAVNRRPWPGSTCMNEYPASLAIDARCSDHEYQHTSRPASSPV